MKRAGRVPAAVAAALAAAWAALGFLFASRTGPPWVIKTGLAAAVTAPLAWIAIYTAQGMLGAGKWWKSDVGTNMVWLEAAAVCTNGVIGWEVFFPGTLASPAAVWIYVGGLFAGALIITWRSVIWLRGFRREPPLLARLRELEAENAVLRKRLSET